MKSSGFFPNQFYTSFDAIKVAAGHSREFVGRIAVHIEEVRDQAVTYSRAHLPENYAYLIERIGNALPEVFAALGSVFGGIFVLPALVVSFGRKIEPSMPIIMNVLKGEFSSEQLVEGLQKTFSDLTEMFDRCMVPAFFVAMLVDSVASFTLGYLTMDLGKMLHASTIALPGACLAAAYMLNQKPEKNPSSAVPIPSAPPVDVPK